MGNCPEAVKTGHFNLLADRIVDLDDRVDPGFDRVRRRGEAGRGIRMQVPSFPSKLNAWPAFPLAKVTPPNAIPLFVPVPAPAFPFALHQLIKPGAPDDGAHAQKAAPKKQARV